MSLKNISRNNSSKKLSQKNKRNLFNSNRTSMLLNKLEIDSIINTNLLDITNYRNNQEYFKEIVFSKKDSKLTRMWLIHLLGGKASCSHFFNINGTLKSDYKIHEELIRLLSWRGTEINDFWIYQKVFKRVSRLWGQFLLLSSSLKQVTHFIHVFIKKFLQIFHLTGHVQKKIDLETKINLIFGSSLGITSLVFDKEMKVILNKIFLISEENNVSINLEMLDKLYTKTKISVQIFLISTVIFSLVTASYESYYYQIEREHLQRYLAKGLSDYHRTQITKFRDLYFEFDKLVDELDKKENSELYLLIDKYYDLHFGNSILLFFKKENNLKVILKKRLQDNISLSNFYLEIKKKKSFYPLAIYFFHQNGTPRTTRNSVCSIIQGLKNISSKSMRILHNVSVISEKRQLNLTLSKKGSPKKKRTIKSK